MRTLRHARLIGFVAALALGSAAHAATITIVNNNAPGVGFNDTTAATPVGGNNGTTKGEQALNIFTRAAEIWGATLSDSVEIKILASFEPLTPCDASSGVLGSAGAMSADINDPSFPIADTWYPAALANKFAGTDLDTANADIRARFNSNIGTAGCLPNTSWYMGLDGNHGTQTDLLTVLLHEFGHGLGFATFVDKASGAEFGNPGHPDVYERLVFDVTANKHWPDMNNNERKNSIINNGNVVWDGANVDAEAPTVLNYLPRLQLTGALTATDQVGEAAFGPTIPNDGTGPTGTVAVTTPADGCMAITTNLTGKIALIDRGTCAFAIKVKNAQTAGAVGVIIADTADTLPVPGMSGSDATITITAVRITKSNGDAIKTALGSGAVTASMNRDTAGPFSGAVGARPQLYSPTVVAAGSSSSHWDTPASPNLLMEPFINDDLTHHLDLTVPLMRDIGWTVTTDVGITKTGPTAIVPGTNAVFTIVVTNNGEATAANVSVADTTPAGLTFVSTSGACTTAFPCDLGTIKPGKSKTITATYSVPAAYTAPDPLLNTATVTNSTADTNAANDSATSSTPVMPSADVAITLTPPAAFLVGTNVAYTVTVTNNGPSAAAAVSVANTTPANLGFVSNTGDCATAYPCALGTLAPGDTRTITTTYSVPGNYTTPNPVVNTVTVSATTSDPNTANNSATSSISLSAPVANAGPDQMVMVSTAGVMLDGSASTGNGLTYAWSQTAGTTVTLSSATAVKPTFTAPATAGTLTFQLTITSVNGLTASDSVDIVVSAAPVPDLSVPADMTAGGDMSLPRDLSAAGDMTETADDLSSGGSTPDLSKGGGGKNDGCGCTVGAANQPQRGPALALIVGFALFLGYRRRSRG